MLKPMMIGVGVLCSAMSVGMAAPVTAAAPYVFQAGEVVISAQMNANFAGVYANSVVNANALGLTSPGVTVVTTVAQLQQVLASSAATSATAAAPLTVVLAPGQYTLSTPLLVPDHVTLAHRGYGVVLLNGSLILGQSTGLVGLSLVNNTSAPAISVTGPAVIRHCVLTQHNGAVALVVAREDRTGVVRLDNVRVAPAGPLYNAQGSALVMVVSDSEIDGVAEKTSQLHYLNSYQVDQGQFALV